MNNLRTRLFVSALVMSIVPLTGFVIALRFLPGGWLPWLLYAGLVAVMSIAAIVHAGRFTRPIARAFQVAQDLRNQAPSATALVQEQVRRDAVEHTLAGQATALAAAERAALRSIGVLHGIAEFSSEGLVFAHFEGHIALINPQAATLLELIGAPTEPGMKVADWLTVASDRFGNEGPAVLKTWQAWLALPGEQHQEWTTPDHRTLHVRSFDVRADDATLLGRVWMFRDTTEQHQMRHRMQEGQKMESIGLLAGGIAHDFNNLLTAIRGSLSLAELESEPAGYRAKVEDASRAAASAAELVSQILGYSRKSTGHRTTTHVNQSLSDVRTILRASLDPKIALRVTTPKQCWSASIDPVELEQVVLNLCLNARDALPDTGGQIDLCALHHEASSLQRNHLLTRPNQDFVCIRVKDNGHGIPPELHERVFETFFTTKDQGKGTGLGLSMAHRIIGAAGGWIEFDSSPQDGTEFRVFIPRALGVVIEPKRDAKPANRLARNSAEGTVLVVDDEAPVRSIAVNMLKYLGYRVLEASDGEEAIHQLQLAAVPIDAVMMDVYMPKLSGRDTYRKMRALGIRVPVIVCSGFMVEADEFTALADGRHAPVQVIQKPYSMDTLAKTVAKAIATGHEAMVA
jgi:two-component system, cell cycle sensor histidine kinase and response regulator CckA